MTIQKKLKSLILLEKKQKKKLKSAIIAFLSKFNSTNELALNLNSLSYSIKEYVQDINELGISLANDHSEINNKPKKDKDSNLIITNASLNLARKSAAYTLSAENYNKGVKVAKASIDSDVELLVATQIFYSYNRQILNNHSDKDILFRWDATLDKLTCAVCASRNGNEYKLNDVPEIPAHVRCRCTIAPLE